ncbi:predicted protein-tyrosine phosphatase [Bellilinea caldifistulae]|uniref:protein-tyrosine phosphatase family protein n=1 Tax=Bellilinea caldifistulae TaxID=360411 RepID=UPI00146FC8C3|nr:dual specificity protein phosphatase family protein [Bellilinea caldifistulae]GAP12002.1 predicted protein-tyrosine phosphatase [Bellilinea caldifistulae]
MEIEGKTSREASMDLAKFLRLFRVRLVTQGVRATFWWLFNVFNRLVLDRPIREQCEITPHLFVGAQFRQGGWRILERWGIRGVINLRAEFDDRQLGLDFPAYLHLPTVDDAAPSLEDLQAGVEFYRQIKNEGGKVYIHCGAGVGRAPSMAAACLISEGLTPSQAWAKIRQVRIFIRLTRVQQEQIERFAERLSQQ